MINPIEGSTHLANERVRIIASAAGPRGRAAGSTSFDFEFEEIEDFEVSLSADLEVEVEAVALEEEEGEEAFEVSYGAGTRLLLGPVGRGEGAEVVGVD